MLREPTGADNCVIWIERDLMPRVKLNARLAAIGEFSPDRAIERVIVNDRRDTGGDDGVFIFEVARGAEERLVLLDRVALIVEHGAAGADPARIHGGRAAGDCSWLGLHLLHRDATKAVGVRAALLKARVARAVLLARERVHECRFLNRLPAKQVVN